MNTSGSPSSPIMLIGEAWGEHEANDLEHRPFVGPTGWELDRMLLEAGLSRADCFCVNVANARPPSNEIKNFFYKVGEAKKAGRSRYLDCYPNDIVLRGVEELRDNILRCKPKLIIPLGATALWALTGKEVSTNTPSGITKWRGSELNDLDQDILEQAWPAAGDGRRRAFVVPTVHPATIFREWPWRYIIVQDFRRAASVLQDGINKPPWQFTVRPTFAQAKECIHRASEAHAKGEAIAVDTETRSGQISCIGAAISPLEAFCIPFMTVHEPYSYWSSSEELELIYDLKAALSSPGGPIVFQNFLYDAQYFAKQFGWVPACSDDTMLMQHTVFPNLRKGLDFLSSLYCAYHRYWKDDGKLWDPRIHSEEQHWRYNCEDCVRTLEVFGVLQGVVSSMYLVEQYRFQMRLLKAVLKTVLRGCRVDLSTKAEMERDLSNRLKDTEQWIDLALGRSFNPHSFPQKAALFYDEMGLPPIKKREGRIWKVTTDASAMEKIGSKYPILKPLTDKINEAGSYQQFHSNYAEMKIPPDHHLRCSFNLTGTVTFRFSASEDAFGYGGNLQTIPKGTEE